MTAEKLQLPLHEGGSDFEKYRRKKSSWKVQIVLCICILVIVNVALFAFTLFYTLSRVRKLENRVESLKNTLSEIRILDANIASALEQLDEDWNIVNDTSEKTVEGEEPKLYMEEYAEPSDYYVDDYDVDNYDQSELNDTEEAIRKEELAQYAVNFTKEGKESSRKKRDVIAATQDGVLINSESYAETRANHVTKNRHRPRVHYSATPSSTRSTYFLPSHRYNSTHYTATPYLTTYRRNQAKQASTPPVYVRKSRVRHTEDKSKAFRQVVKKSSLKSGTTFANGENSSETEFTIVRDENLGRRRYIPLEIRDERHPRVGRVRLPCVHYSGDTSKYVVGQHTNFNGNGHLRHPQRTFVDWKISDWVVSAGMDALFTMDEGVLTIKEPGVYFIYAQIYYLDEHDTTGFRVHKNSESILQCTVTAHSAERKIKGNTCYTAGTEYLSEGDTISLADVTSGRYSLFEPGKSFFGLVKFSDIKIK